MKTIAFFNNKGGVGKTTLVYHLAWMFADLGVEVIAADLDPQANLSAMFLEDEDLEALWEADAESTPRTISGAVEPIRRGLGDIAAPEIHAAADNIGLLVGNLGLSRFEDRLSQNWPLCLDGDEAAFRSVSAFYRLIQEAGKDRGADLALIDVGPNLGALNRAALLAADYVIIPLMPDLFSLQGLKNLGPTLRKWQDEWRDRLKKRPADLPLPPVGMQPAGYVVLQHSVRLDRPTKAYQRWTTQIPQLYRTEILNETGPGKPGPDANRLYLLKHYRSLMPLAMEARKPIFQLLPADGAIGAHMQAVQDCREDFRKLARKIAERCEIAL